MTNIEKWLLKNKFHLECDGINKKYLNDDVSVYICTRYHSCTIYANIVHSVLFDSTEQANETLSTNTYRCHVQLEICQKISKIHDPWNELSEVKCECCHKMIKYGDVFYQDCDKAFCSISCYGLYSGLTERKLDKKALKELKK